MKKQKKSYWGLITIYIDWLPLWFRITEWRGDSDQAGGNKCGRGEVGSSNKSTTNCAILNDSFTAGVEPTDSP